MTTRTPRNAPLVIALILALTLVPAAFAAKSAGTGGHKPGGGGGGTGSGTISMALVTDANANGLPNWADTVTFNVSTSATTQPWVNLKCTQNGKVVAQGWNGYFAGSLTGTNFQLASPTWSGGAADCTAYLTTPTWSVLASTSFHVGA